MKKVRVFLADFPYLSSEAFWDACGRAGAAALKMHQPCPNGACWLRVKVLGRACIKSCDGRHPLEPQIPKTIKITQK
eukprot:1007069-Amphidinium_carterae.1